MSMPLSLARRISSGRVTLADLREEAERTLGARSEKRKRTAPKRKPSREAKEAKRAAHRDETARLREALVVLADSRCERCGMWLPADVGHMHHTRGGSGRRRQEQSIENVAWLCHRCHAFMHAHPDFARSFRDALPSKRAGRSPSPASPQETP